MSKAITVIGTILVNSMNVGASTWMSCKAKQIPWGPHSTSLGSWFNFVYLYMCH
jgi:hypothetical protein